LRRANLETVVVSVTEKKEVNGSHNIKVIADELFENINYKNIEMIVLPGGMPGSSNLNAHEGLKNQILDFHKKGKPLGAICAAPLVLGNLGVLKNQTATCYPGFEKQLLKAKVTGKNVEHSKTIITGKGAGVAIRFALKIVEMLKGKKLAEELALKMIVTP